jgi:NAD(P)-dependent dehydrogenase (short-subunit alcohol dehydrogenase family)
MGGLLAGKVVMVTGAASGIGRAAAIVFAHQGAKVVVTDIDPHGAVTVERIRQADGIAEFVLTDVSDQAQVEAAVAFAAKTYGRLDGAFNNAAVPERLTRLLEGTEADFDRIMSINVKGLWMCMRAQIRQMQAQGGGGSIVNTASTAGLRGSARMSIYSASKHAVIGFTKSAALEFARSGPRINAICPGVIETPMLRHVVAGDERASRAFLASQPNGRLGNPDEIGEAAAWLLSDAASFVTGTAMIVDGGQTS